HVFGRLPKQSALRRGKSLRVLVFRADVSRDQEYKPVLGSGGVCQRRSSGTDREWSGEHDQRSTGFRRLLQHAGIESCGGPRSGIERRLADGSARGGAQLWSLAKLLRRRSEEHTSELQSHLNLVCRLLLEKKKVNILKDNPIDINKIKNDISSDVGQDAEETVQRSRRTQRLIRSAAHGGVHPEHTH